MPIVVGFFVYVCLCVDGFLQILKQKILRDKASKNHETNFVNLRVLCTCFF